jgi:hypothetical protein
MESKICLDCNSVWMGGKDNKCSDCKSKNVEIFSPEKHGGLLVSHSNAWLQVWKKWGNCELMQEPSQKLYDEGCYGAGSHLNAFIQFLIDNQCECKKKN